MSVVVNRDWPDVVKSCSLDNWREALAILVTYAKPEEFAPLCDLLGQRLEAQQDDNYAHAMVCYICAGNVEKFVSCWYVQPFIHNELSSYIFCLFPLVFSCILLYFSVDLVIMRFIKSAKVALFSRRLLGRIVSNAWLVCLLQRYVF